MASANWDNTWQMFDLDALDFFDGVVSKCLFYNPQFEQVFSKSKKKRKKEKWHAVLKMDAWFGFLIKMCSSALWWLLVGCKGPLGWIALWKRTKKLITFEENHGIIRTIICESHILDFLHVNEWDCALV